MASNPNRTSRLLRVRAFLFALGCLYSLLCCRYLTGTGYVRGFESEAIARSLASSGTFGNPYQMLATGLTAHLPPLHPALLGLLLRLFRDQPSSHYFYALNIMTAVLFGVVVAGLPPLAKALFGRPLPGYVAAILITTMPVVQVLLGWDGVLVSALLVSFCLLSSSPTPRYLLTGLLAAAVSLTNVSGLFFIAVLSFGLLLLKQWTLRRFATSFSLCFAFCLPWLTRNYLELGSFCMRDNFGLELQVSNNDLAHAFTSDNLKSAHIHYHPNLSSSEAALLRAIGEVEYNKRKLHQALSWIETHPIAFSKLSAEHYFFFWFPDGRVTPFAPVIWIFTAISLPAMLSSLRRVNKQSVLVAALLAFSLPYALVQAELRYRTPVIWLTMLFAGESMALLWVRWRLSRYVVIPPSDMLES